MDALITVSGNLGTEVEHRAGDGYSYANFRLACTPRLRRGDEWVDGNTTWLTVECANRIADNARDSLAKGDPVIVSGRLRTRVWRAGDEHNERLVIEATALGHDLSRGTSRFTRNPARSSDPVSAASADEAEEPADEAELQPASA